MTKANRQRPKTCHPCTKFYFILNFKKLNVNHYKPYSLAEIDEAVLQTHNKSVEHEKNVILWKNYQKNNVINQKNEILDELDELDEEISEPNVF